MTDEHDKKMFGQRDAHLGHLPCAILRDIARNESATRDWRKAAVELMLDKECKEVSHPELASLLAEIKGHREAKDEVQAVVESAIEAPLDLPAPKPGPFTASVTTKTMQQDTQVG